MASILSNLKVTEKPLQPPKDDDEDIARISDPETGLKPSQQLVPRPTPVIWFFVCVGLYLGAMLYGKKPLTL